ncbi:MAG: Asp-tRNA(Asn)/Glu-tRNA(Gln) amidotransferase subunit GatA [Holosporales bacterium]
MSQELTRLTMTEALEGLSAKKISCVELTTAYIQKMEATKDLNAYITPTPDLAMDQAKAVDARLAKGEALRPMEGMPIAMKDLFCTKGVRTTAASKILGNFVPTYESTVSANLWNAGSIMLGKANLDEFAMGSANITSAFGNVISPWRVKDDERRFVPGGSSGGSVAAVAAGAAIAAIGTDTGGSIRQPAAFTGLVGLKPTYGLCSRWGIVAFASSLDQAGPLTRDVKDCALMMRVMAGHDPKDATSAQVTIPDYLSALEANFKGKRIGIPKEYRVEGMSAETNAMWEKGIAWMRDAGAEIVEISLPHTKYALPTYYVIAPAEASSNLARYDGVRYGLRVPGESLDELYELTRAEGFGQEVRRRIMIGTYVLSAGYYDAYYLKAQKVRRLITQDFEHAFDKVDLILTPTTPHPAFAFGEEPKDPVSMYMNDVLTVPANLAGIPAISVPAALSGEGLPMGLQLLGRAFDEMTLLQGAYIIEKAANFAAEVAELRRAS